MKSKTPTKTPAKSATKKSAKVEKVETPAVAPVVDSPPEVEHYVVHAEAVQAVEEGNQEFVVEVKPKLTLLDIARQAWHEVKDVSDPEFDNCVPTHKDKFCNHAEAVLNGSTPLTGDTVLARFEQAVNRLNKGE